MHVSSVSLSQTGQFTDESATLYYNDRYKDAVATIRRTTTEFNYQLVITRAYEEGEEQLLEEDDECECSFSMSMSQR